MSLAKEIHLDLQTRYSLMAMGTDSEKRVIDMMDMVVKNIDDWPKDKSGRWVGYVQCLLVEVEKVTTIDEERDYTRPMFHALYGEAGYDVPESVEV